MESWLQDTPAVSNEYQSAMSAISSARSNIAWGDKYVDEIMTAIKGGAAQVIASFILVTILTILAMAV